jgi:hypothetical protein
LNKISVLFLRFSPEFRCSNISAVTEHTRNQIFFERYPKNFFFKIFTLVLLDRFLDGFSKFWFFTGEIFILIRDFWVIFENYSMRMLSIRGNDFIACWAYAEPISSHAEQSRKCLKVEYLARIKYNFQKSRVTGPWDHKVSVSAKKVKKKFHACVPLISFVSFITLLHALQRQSYLCIPRKGNARRQSRLWGIYIFIPRTGPHIFLQHPQKHECAWEFGLKPPNSFWEYLCRIFGIVSLQCGLVLSIVLLKVVIYPLHILL